MAGALTYVSRDACAGLEPSSGVKMEVVGLQALQAGLAGSLDPAPAGILRINLADEENLVPDAREHLAQHNPGGAIPYISAVSIRVRPRSIPARSAAISSLRAAGILAHPPKSPARGQARGWRRTG